MAGKVRLALEGARGAPAVTLDGELAAITGVVAGRAVGGCAVVVNSVAVVVDDGETGVVAVAAADGTKVTSREDNLEVLGRDGGRGRGQEEEDGFEGSSHDCVECFC